MTGKCITINQKSYVDNLEPFEFKDLRFDERSLTDHECDMLRSKVGQLLWLCNQTQPDISFETIHIASNVNQVTTKEIAFFNKVVRILKTDKYQIEFTQLVGDLHIVIYVDAAFGNLADGVSQGDILFFL